MNPVNLDSFRERIAAIEAETNEHDELVIPLNLTLIGKAQIIRYKTAFAFMEMVNGVDGPDAIGGTIELGVTHALDAMREIFGLVDEAMAVDDTECHAGGQMDNLAPWRPLTSHQNGHRRQVH